MKKNVNSKTIRKAHNTVHNTDVHEVQSDARHGSCKGLELTPMEEAIKNATDPKYIEQLIAQQLAKQS